jgi:hypothetical protein
MHRVPRPSKSRRPPGRSFVRVLFGGVNETVDLSLPSTSGWQVWTGVTKTRVRLGAGWQVLRVFMVGGTLNVNWIEIEPPA